MKTRIKAGLYKYRYNHMKIDIEKIEGGIDVVPGVQAAAVSCGLKKGDPVDDLALVYLTHPAVAAGVFTMNKFRAAPLLVTEKHLNNSVRALVVNSGNANACTGEQGLSDALATAQAAAERLGLQKEDVLVASTGVIGSFMPMDKITAGITEAAATLSPSGGRDAARAIMTTDTFPKESAYRVSIIDEGEGKESVRLSFKIAGMAKGAGMICPDMATMLAFVFTDLELERDFMQEALGEAVKRSFNLISVDGDTSTNDMVLLFSCPGVDKGGDGDGKELLAGYEILKEAFNQVLLQLCRDLAVMMVKDGEGAIKLISLTVRGAKDYNTARKIARSVLNSSLVKTAFFGEDANIGRIMNALGYSGAEFDPLLVDLYLADLMVVAGGCGLSFDEQKAAEILRLAEIPVLIDLHMGEEELLAWGCDLGYDYIKINSSYRS